MLTLYDYLPSQNAWKVRQLLQHLDRPCQQEFVSVFEGEGYVEAYRRINPVGAVPAIKLDDGGTLAESNAILVYPAAGSPYWPDDALQQGKVMQWLFFEADYVQSSVATLRHWVMTGKDQHRSAEHLKSRHAASLKVLCILERVLEQQTYLTDFGYSIADMVVFAYVHLAGDAGISLADFPAVQRWIDAVRSQPGFLETVYPYSMDEYACGEL